MLEPDISALQRAERFMNDLHRANEAALGFGTARGLGAEALEASKDLRAKAVTFFKIEGTTRKKVTEHAMLEALTRSVALFTRDDLGVKSADPDAWVRRMRIDYWWLSNAVHGGKVALDEIVGWSTSPDSAGEAVITYPDRVYEECMSLAFMAYVAASRAAVQTLGYDSDPWNAIVATHMSRAAEVIEAALARGRKRLA